MPAAEHMNVLPTLPDYPDLIFESARHIYKLNGKYIPAVSTILKPLSSAFYKGIDEAIMQTAAERGTAIHESIENYIKFDIVDHSEEIGPQLSAFMEWWGKYKPVPIRSEYRVYHPLYRYAGTSDLICLVEDKITCIDFKSTATINDILVRPQLEAYEKAVKAHKFPIEAKAVLHLQKDGSYEFIRYKPNDSEAWEVFGALLTIYGYQQKFK